VTQSDDLFIFYFSGHRVISQQSHFFETMSEATRAGKSALAELRANRAA
jgi:hypothetical protein